MAIHHVTSIKDLDAADGHEFVAISIEAELGERLRDLSEGDRGRLEAWLREDLELAGQLAGTPIAALD